jgi:cysteine-rich repeat protein
MSPARSLVPLLALLSLRCTPDGGSGFASTSATQTTGPSTTQTSFPTGTTDPGSSGTTAVPTTGDVTTAATTSEPTGTTSTSTGPSTSTSDATSTTDPSSTSTSTTGSTGPGDPVCGDGVIEGDEQCDDGNAADDDACLADCTPGRTLLVLAGAGEAPGVFARWLPGAGWTSSQAGTGVVEAAFVATPTGALAVVRRHSPKAQDDNELAFAPWSPGQPDDLLDFADVGVFGVGLDGPGLAAVADTATLAFLGTDFKHYSSVQTGGTWAPFAPIPAGMVQTQAFGPSAAALAGGEAETYAVYAGDDGKIYYSLKSSPGGAWQASSQASPPSVVNTLTPAALIDDQGDLLIAYVRKTDGKIGVAKLTTPQNTWTTEVVVASDAITASELAFLRTDAGAYYIAWKGFDSDGIHAVRGTAHNNWDAPFTVDQPMTASSPPALARGLIGAEAELVFVTGGELRHARLVGSKAEDLATVPALDGLAPIRPAAARAQLKP